MSRIHRLRAPDSTLALMREGYAFIPNRCGRLRADAFRTRVLGSPVVCVTGADAAEMFYSPGRFTRRGALPKPVLTLLQDEGSVQVLDGAAHRHRKQMFLDRMAPDSLARLTALAAQQWRGAAARWEGADRVVLLGEVRNMLCRAACAWTGVPLADDEVGRRTADFAAMIDGTGPAALRHLRGRLGRLRTEHWIKELVTAVRAGRVTLPAGSPAAAVIAHRDLDGAPLSADVATVELINLIRPVVAVARFVVFTALALHEHPHARERARTGGDDEVRRFVQEVRRFYPFFPAVGGRARESFEWRGHRFDEGTWVLLDLYGTNHDARVWDRPGVFDPDRFRHWDDNPFTLVPQGGGDHLTGHRCAGEWGRASGPPAPAPTESPAYPPMTESSWAAARRGG